MSLPSFAADLPLPLETLPNKTFTDVQNRAATEAVSGPVWGNAPDPKTLSVHQTFRGTVTADATLMKLAIFSDDGSDVFVDGVKVWSGKDQGQALPVLSQSLHALPVTLTPGSHSVEIDYSNIFYVPADASKGIPPDIDGCTLFEYGGLNFTLTSDKSALCAGGWTPTYQYQYLQKETGKVVSRVKPDPHIATLTATMLDYQNKPVSGQTVTFTWSMPAVDTSGNEAPLVESHTATTNSSGVATYDVTSGNEVASGVKITAVCQSASGSTNLDVQAANVDWQYQCIDKNGNPTWQEWDGTLAGLQTGTDTSLPIPLQVVETFNGTPVIGHAMNWLLSQVLDESGHLVMPADDGQYWGYGHFSGSISTTGKNGTANANFTMGFYGGQITMAVDDYSVYDSSP